MKIKNEKQLDEMLSEPTPELIAMVSRLKGDIMVLGVAGKMGVTLARMAKRAIEASKKKREVYGVARFSNPDAEKKLKKWGIKTIRCDLMDQNAVNSLPEVPNIIYMAGLKFGTSGAENLTWAMNVTVPGYIAQKFKKSKIVAFSTGCVYPLVPMESCGCAEDVPPEPIGEYSQSCLGRERIFSYFSEINKTPVLLYRLNYAIDLRYGVLHDIAWSIWNDKPVSASVGHFNVIWQGDANNYALRCLELCESPAVPLNITGPETVSVHFAAEKIGKIMKKKVTYQGESKNKAYLNNAAKSFQHFGYPKVSLEEMIERQAHWIMDGQKSLGKPTHFEVNDGKF